MAIAFITTMEPKGFWNGAVITAALFSEMAFIVYFFPFITKQEQMMKSLGWAAVTAVMVILVNLVPTIMLFGPELTANMAYPTLEVIRFIRAGAFVENLDPLLIVFWLFTVFLKISIFMLTAVIALTHTVKMQNHKPFSWLMTAAVVFFALYAFSSAADVERMTAHSETAVLLLPNLVPLLYLMVDWLRAFANRSSQKAQ